MEVKWPQGIKVAGTAAEAEDEAFRFPDPQGCGQSLIVPFPMEVKSLITRPAPGLRLTGPGLYELSGIAWSGRGKVRKVEVSADGGQSWAEAALSAPGLADALTRFRIPWKWNGAPPALKLCA